MANVFLHNVVSMFALTITSAMVRHGLSDLALFILYVIVSCQIFNVMLTTGLFGKSLAEGIGIGSLLAASLAIAAMIPTSATPDAFRSLLVMPFVVCMSAWPFLIARFVWGWQLTDRPTELIPFRRLCMGDFFLLTASVAAIYILTISASPRFPSNNMMFLFLSMIVVFGIGTLFSFAFFGITYLYFRSRVGGGATFCLLIGVFLPHHLYFGLAGGGIYSILFLSGAPLCALGCLICLIAYKTGGYRLVKHERREVTNDELSEADQAYLRESRRSSRWATALLLLAAVTASSVFFSVDKESSRERAASAQVD